MRALATAAAAVTIWGVSFIATKVALRETGPLQVIWIRFGIGFLVLGGVVAARKEFRLPSANELLRFAILGFVGITFHQWLQVTGLITAQASTTAWIVSTSPVFIALLGWTLLREQMDVAKMLGMLLAAAGVLGVVSRGTPGLIFGGHFGSAGDGFVLGSAFTWAIFSVFSRKYLKAQSATLMLLFVMLFGWVFTSVLLLLNGQILPGSTLSGGAIAALLFLGIFCSGIAYIFWYNALRLLPASQVGSLLFFEPLITIIAASLILGEAITAGTLVGGGMILAGVWLVTRPRHKTL